MHQALLFLRDAITGEGFTQSLTEALHDAAAELGLDPLHVTEADQLRIIDRALENCPP